MSLGTNIKRLRIEHNMTQEDLAVFLNTTVKSVSRWENEVTYPDISLLPLLANVFEITVDELLDVEKVKMDEYIKSLLKKELLLERNNDFNGLLNLWKEAYNKFPNNENISVSYVNAMSMINVIKSKVVYNNEIVEICERLINKSINHLIKDQAIENLVGLYTMLDNTEKADYYAKQLTRNYLYTYDVIKTRYLRGDELLKAIQNNS